MKRRETAGPPLYAALPIVLKIPAPTIPATPSAVRSMTERLLLRCNPPESDSVLFRICFMDFFLKSSSIISYMFRIAKFNNSENFMV